MIIIKTAAEMSDWVRVKQSEGRKIGFVPTMGALHAGHLSLLKTSLNQTAFTVCSIFINPTQFNDPEDFRKYPVQLEDDLCKLLAVGCNVLFLPSVKEIYPDGVTSLIHYDLGSLENILEGAYRPGHFQGVCQVVHRLLEIVKPDDLYLGQKDFQQTLIIKRLIKLLDLNIQTIVVKTFRQPTGLALSSRNVRLNPEQQETAASMYKMLLYIKDNYKTMPSGKLESHVRAYLLEKGFTKIDYVVVADAQTLRPVLVNTPVKRAIALIAAVTNEVRLIDNMILE